MANYRAMDGVSGRPGTGSSGTQPPAASTGFTGWYGTGTLFQVTGTSWFTGYWWYRADTAQSGAAQEFALWSVPPDNARRLFVPGSHVTSGTLGAGWNYVALAAPLLLTRTWPYRAVTTLQNNFPFTASQLGAGMPYAGGITSGPLNVFSANGAGNPPLWVSEPQTSYQTGNSDPAVAAGYPLQDNSSFLGWLDIQVTDTAPAGAAYSLWPNLPWADVAGTGDNGDGYTMGLQFRLSQSCTLNKIRFWSAPAAGAAPAVLRLPGRCGIWDVTSQTVVTGTDNPSPAWKREPAGGAASPGDGWVYCDYSGSGVVLAAGIDYKAAVWAAGPAAGQWWRTATTPFWAAGGAYSAAGQGGAVNGPVTAPNAAGSSPGQNSWHGPNLAWGYPGSYNNPENDFADIEVTPATIAGAASAAAAAAQPAVQVSMRPAAGTAVGTAPAPAVATLSHVTAQAGLAAATAIAPPLPAGIDITVRLGPTTSRAQAAVAAATQGDGTAAGIIQGDGTAAGAVQGDGAGTGPTTVNRRP